MNRADGHGVFDAGTEIEEVAAGMPLDDEAVAEIYREHGPMLRRVVWRATSDANRVDDIVQEVILRVWRQAPEADNLRAYLITTARHLIVDQHRAAGRRPQEARMVDIAQGPWTRSSSRRRSDACSPTTEISSAVCTTSD